ncbi:MAG TPA: DUF6600 domain-containing protein [Polyangiaceae bacterium]
MIGKFRAASALVVTLLVTLLAAPRAAAAEGDWFDGSARPAPPPQGAPPPPAGERSAPQPLEPSPLYDQGSAPDDSYDRNPEALTKFRPYLDPYGTWTDDPTYGRIWIPNANVVGPGFQPYVSNGRWALDEAGEWIWVSDYPFGWVVFHYGRWVWIPSAGSWGWIPGYEYAPAWVTWRVPTGSYAYVGWSPAPPTFVWFGGVSVWWGYDPYYWWVFCPSPYLFHHHVGYYVVADDYWRGYAHGNTRPYVPARPQPRGASRSAAAPRRSPSLDAARVPAAAIPAERVSSRPSMSSARPSLSGDPGGRRYSTGTGTASRSSYDSRPAQASRPSSSKHSFESFRSREGRAPSVGTQRLAPMRASPSRMRAPDMRASPRAVRPSSRR